MASLKKHHFLIACCAVLIPIFYNNCASNLEGEKKTDLAAGSALNAQCVAELEGKFATIYHPFLKTNCAACHASGPGSGFFASNDVRLSMDAFLTKTAVKIEQFAVSTHKPPYTGAQLTNEINGLKPQWQAAEAAYEACKTAAPPDPGGSDPKPGLIVEPNKLVIAKSANPVVGAAAPVVLSWNLASEFADAANAVAGLSFQLSVRAVNTSGITAYTFENPRIINQSANSVFVRGINVYVNDALVDGETFLFSSRYIPNVTNNNSRRIAPGAAFFPSAVGAPINVKVAFAQVSTAEIDFRPLTYTDLTAAGGIFAANCLGCHGASGGLSLAAGNYANVVGRTAASDKVLANPYDLKDNFILERMSTAGAPMPPAGLLPQDARDRVRDWILDGTPLNANSIAR